MQIIKYIFIIFLFIGCTEETKMNEKTVNVEYAKGDGFEIVALDKSRPISIQYKEYNKKDKQFLTYLIPKDKIESIEKSLKGNEDSSNFFVKLYVKNFSKTKQEICLEFHYSKSTYKYCYDVNDKKVIPKYSEYHDFYKNERINYKQ